MSTHIPVRWRNEQTGARGVYCKWCHLRSRPRPTDRQARLRGSHRQPGGEMTSYPRPYPPIPTPGTSSFQPTGPTLRGETTMPDNKTRTVVTVYRPVGDGPPVRYEATNYDVGKQGELDVIDGSRTVATWSQNAWTRAEFAEEIPDFELREGEPVAEPGTFEVYPGPDGNYRFNLRAADGERLAYSQGYALRQSALNAIAEVQQAAAGALIEDVDQ